MAAGKIKLQKASGGVTSITGVDGVGDTSLAIPESGTLIAADANGNVGIGVAPKAKLDVYALGIIGGLPAATGAAADPNTMARISGGTVCMDFGAESNGHQWIQCRNLVDYSTKYNLHLQPNGGNVLVTGTGALGYGTGSGGTVTQLTSKGTSVTLNKPTGQITMNNAALAAGASVTFQFVNSLISSTDNMLVNLREYGGATDAYIVTVTPFIYGGGGYITLINRSGISLSDAVVLKFSIIKGANS